jgi:lysophospholipase L1-like esterase
VVKPKTTKAKKGSSKPVAPSKNKANPNNKTAKPASVAPSGQLLKFSRIHAQIGQIQTELAAQHGCLAWSMQEAMGGVGSAYPWARKNPPLMASDLIHFTPAGYRELANSFMADFGLTAP